jgi:7-keto-8-aminopelargonate synthetase-like enzyme
MNAASDSLRRFQNLRGPDVIARTQGFLEWQQGRIDRDEWSFHRSIVSRDACGATIEELNGRVRSGFNFASQDYLGLSLHPLVHSAIAEALARYGPHSAGSDALVGSSTLSVDLRREISEFLAAKHIVLFPTGWAAGYGIIRGLIREPDHVVMDALSHTCLVAGAQASTQKILMFRHNDCDSLREKLKIIRNVDKANGILVITESVFSMDSDGPDLGRIQSLASEYGATLLVDAAHDLGAMGPDGTGRLGESGLLGSVDLVLGTFSKTFCTNGGFLATNHEAAARYVRGFGVSNTFSNALGNLQAAAAIAAIRIVRSAEGHVLRRQLTEAVRSARRALRSHGFTVVGEFESAIVPVLIGDEREGRRVCSEAARLGVITNFIEYPAVQKGKSRLRLQLSPAHSDVDMNWCAARIAEARTLARAEVTASSPTVPNLVPSLVPNLMPNLAPNFVAPTFHSLAL